MKKITLLFTALLVILSLSACGDPPAEIQNAEKPLQIANPYGTYETIREMEDASGLVVSLPQTLPDWVNETIYRAIPGELAEILYTDGSNEIRVRIKNGTEDISGVYDTDAREEKDVAVGEYTVHLKGETQENGDFLVFVSTWNTSEGRTYSVTSRNGVSETVLLPLLSQIR